MYVLIWSGIQVGCGDDRKALGVLAREISARHPHIAPARVQARR